MQGDLTHVTRSGRGQKVVLWLLIAVLVLGVAGSTGFRLWKSAKVSHDAPVVGLSLDTQWYNRLGFAQAAFEIALTRADARTTGFRPGEAHPEEILESIDALFLAGGGDIDPALYGGDRRNRYGIDPEHDAFERDLIRGALRRDMPILGICRGIQILNVVHGGTLRNLHLDSDLISTHGIRLHSLKAHTVSIVDGSLLDSASEPRIRTVNSFHGRAVDRIGAYLVAVAHSPDGVVEAIERPDRSFVLGLQWHPEILSLEDPAALSVFRDFVEAAREYRSRRLRRARP